MAHPNANHDPRDAAPFPLWKGLAASVVAHALAAVVIGAMPRFEPHSQATTEGLFEELPAVVTMDAPELSPPESRAEIKPPEPEPDPTKDEQPKLAKMPPDSPRVLAAKEPEPKRVKLGSPTSTSEAATMTWIGFDEFIEHSGTPSEVDQAQFTMDAPGPRGALPSEGITASPGMPVAPSPAPVAQAEPPPQPPAPTGDSPIARATDDPLLISDVERRPRAPQPDPLTSDSANPTRPDATTVNDLPQGKAAPASESPRPPEIEAGPAREKVEPTAPAPKSLAKEVRGEDKEEIAAPSQGNAPGESTVTPREAVEGAESPRFPVSDKAIEPSKDSKAVDGPTAEAQKAQRPDSGSDGKATEGSGKGDAAPQPAAKSNQGTPPPATESPSPTKAPTVEAIAEGIESQGPRPDPSRVNEKAAPSRTNDADRNLNSAKPAPPVTPGIPAQPRVGTGLDGRGVLSDRESLAAAIKKAVVVDKWGQPLVAKGLRIRTVRPKFSKYTEITAHGSPVIRICFDRLGKAREVIVLSSSGIVDVDRPVVDAAYQWTAVGKELETLGDNPPETVAIDVRVIR